MAEPESEPANGKRALLPPTRPNGRLLRRVRQLFESFFLNLVAAAGLLMLIAATGWCLEWYQATFGVDLSGPIARDRFVLQIGWWVLTAEVIVVLLGNLWRVVRDQFGGPDDD